MLKWILSLGLILTGPLAAEIRVLAFSGSLREGSFNKKLVVEASEIARSMGAKVTVINLNDYTSPFYDETLEKKSGMPAKAKQLRQLMIESNAVMIASPEYNGSLSAALKNAIDWASRSEDGKSSRDAFKGKKFAIMSTSPGGGGGARGLVHLRAIIENVGGTVVQKEVVVPYSFEAFSTDGKLKNVQTKQELKQMVQQLLN
jgi:chromate reductase